MSPDISVITPCFNEPENIFRASIESVLNQTKKNIEIIVILDAPENNLLRSIIQEFQEEHKNIVFLDPGEHMGRGEARNLGIQQAKGEYIAIHDADDIDYPNRLEDQYRYMESHPDISVLFSDIEFINAEGDIIQSIQTNVDNDCFFFRKLNHPTMFIKKDVIQNYDNYKNMNTSEDTDLWTRLFIGGEKFGETHKTHTQYLIPEHSPHSDYVDKIKNEQINSLKTLKEFRQHLSSEKYYYRMIIYKILDIIFLSLGKNIFLEYQKYRSKIISFIKKMWYFPTKA